MNIQSSNLGFPRIGSQRELKKALEQFWSKKITSTELMSTARTLCKQHWKLQQQNNLDYIPCFDFSLYDHMLDMAVSLNVIPKPYQTIEDPLTQYFAMARGLQDQALNIDVPALTMTKWFDTNYHYLVPEIDDTPNFKFNPSRTIETLHLAREANISVRPVIVGPVSFLLLSKMRNAKSLQHPIEFINQLLPAYEDWLNLLQQHGVEWVQMDEPCLTWILSAQAQNAFRESYSKLLNLKRRPKIMLTSYFDSIESHWPLLKTLPLDGLHIDLVRAPQQLETILKDFLQETLLSTVLSLGVVDGRNIWKTDLEKAYRFIEVAQQYLPLNRLMIAPSCSLLHSPIDLKQETRLDDELLSWLAFATQKLQEIQLLKEASQHPKQKETLFKENKQAILTRQQSPRIHKPNVQKAIESITVEMIKRPATYEERVAIQRKQFNLPDFPTTTIGSFPQTEKVRKARADWRANRLSDQAYQHFLEEETKFCIQKQEDIGLDVLVHGEFERNDMVEYFGEQLDGFAFTLNGWVQSYGSRCVKPPIIFGDVSRPKPMTVEWATYAQSLTKKPIKGMLTGPVTILQWSFVRDDQPRKITCQQIALALREELKDLEEAGIRMIQVDEPALREGLPLRQSEWAEYLNWAVGSFRLATSGVKNETQIHTHMCYSEFGDIVDAIIAMDADVLSIETSRSHMEIFKELKHISYPNEIGPGVYDIHSPRIPSMDEMLDLISAAKQVISPRKLWVNPDCGLKTRSWTEVEPALKSMVSAAQQLRTQ